MAPALFKRHLLGLAIGLVPLVVAWAFDYRKLQGWIGPLLLARRAAHPLAADPRARGDRQGRDVVARGRRDPALPAFRAGEAAHHRRHGGGHRDATRARSSARSTSRKVLGILAVPLGLILLQPDLGTGMVFVAITAGMLLIGGLKPRWFLVLGDRWRGRAGRQG